MKKLLIFDMDGTLLDSMRYWKYLGRNYLNSKNKVIEENLEDIISHMTLEESAVYFQENYGIEGQINEIVEDIMEFMSLKYVNEIPLKKGVKDYLEKVNKLEYKLCVLTVSNKKQAVEALKRNKIFDFFDCVFTDKDFGLSKRSSEIYIKTCEKMNAIPYETTVFEDALYALKSAKEAGCEIIGVYDDDSKCDWNEITDICDKTILSFSELI